MAKECMNDHGALALFSFMEYHPCSEDQYTELCAQCLMDKWDEENQGFDRILQANKGFPITLLGDRPRDLSVEAARELLSKMLPEEVTAK